MLGSHTTVHSCSRPIQVDCRTSQGKSSESLVFRQSVHCPRLYIEEGKETKDDKWDMPSHPHEGLLFHFDWGTFTKVVITTPSTPYAWSM